MEAAAEASHFRRPYTSVQHCAVCWRAKGHLRVTLAIKYDLGKLLLACERDHVLCGTPAASFDPQYGI